jgi:hypothetical protein
MVISVGGAYSQPFGQTLDKAIMDNFVEIQEKFLGLGTEIEYVDVYISLLMSCNSYLMYPDYNDPYNDDIRIFIQQVFDSGEFDPEGSTLVTQLFNTYNIENGFYKFVIAGTIAQILIFENVVLGKYPELLAYINKISDYHIDANDFDRCLNNVNNLLRSFNKRDVELLRKYMDLIMQGVILSIKE